VQERRDGVAPRHVAEHTVVSGLQRDVQVAADGRRLTERLDELRVDVVDLDRREAQPRETGNRAHFPHEPRQLVARLAVAVAAEVDPGEHDLAMPLRHAAARLGEAPPRQNGSAMRRGRAGSRRSCTRSCSRPGSSRTRAPGRAARRPEHSRACRRRPRRMQASPRFAGRRP
jgi:hypothetical protein